MVHNQENNKSVEIDPELTQMLELADQDTETFIITIFHMFKKLNRDIGDIKKSQVELLETKITISELKTHQPGLMAHQTLQKINELEVQQQKLSKMKHTEEKGIFF